MTNNLSRRGGITRVKELLEADVNVSCGQDCVNDDFYPLVVADMLQVANVTIHAAQMKSTSGTGESFRYDYCRCS